MGGLLEGLAEAAGEEMPDTAISGFDWAHSEQGTTFIYALLLCVAVAAVVNRPVGYIACGILGGLTLFAAPMPRNELASYSYGFYLVISGLLGMAVTGVIFGEND